MSPSKKSIARHRVAAEARVEELVGIPELRSVGKGQLHLVLVGVGDRDHSVAGPHRAAHPLPFLDDLAVGRKNALADAGEGLAAPVGEFCDQLVDTFRCDSSSAPRPSCRRRARRPAAARAARPPGAAHPASRS